MCFLSVETSGLADITELSPLTSDVSQNCNGSPHETSLPDKSINLVEITLPSKPVLRKQKKLNPSPLPKDPTLNKLQGRGKDGSYTFAFIAVACMFLISLLMVLRLFSSVVF